MATPTRSETTRTGTPRYIKLTIGGTVTISAISQLGNNLTTPPSTQEGFTGGLAAVPVDAGARLAPPGSLDGHLRRRQRHDIPQHDRRSTARLPPRSRSTWPRRPGKASRPRAISPTVSTSSAVGSHTYAQAMTAPLTVVDQGRGTLSGPQQRVRSTATDRRHGHGRFIRRPRPCLRRRPSRPTRATRRVPWPWPVSRFPAAPTPLRRLQRHDRLGRRQPSRHGCNRDLRDDDHCQRPAYLCSLQATFSPTVVLDDATGDSATATDAISVVADLTASPPPRPSRCSRTMPQAS